MERLIVRFGRLASCLLLVAACGPTATAITTPPPGIAGPPLPSGGLSTPALSTPALSTPVPTISVPPDSRWQLASDFPADNAYEVVSIVNTGNGFTAAGSAPAPGEDYYGRSQGLVWTSADGQSWQVTADPGLLYTEPLKLAALGSDQYIVGDYEPCTAGDTTCADGDKAGNSVFRSSAAGGWSMLPQNADLQAAGFIDGMIAGHDQLLVYGGAGDDAGTTTVWRSSDGTNWSSFADPELEQITAMTATSSGFVMFALTYNGSSNVEGLVALSSADGASFSPLSLPDLSALPYPEIDGVATNGSSVVGVGYTEDDQGNDTALVLFSADGTNWSVAHDSDGSFTGSNLADVVAIDSGYLGFGYAYASVDSQQLVPQAWYSADGQNWRALAKIPGAFDDVDASAASSQAALYITDITNDVSATDVQIDLYPWYAPISSLLAP